MRLIILTGASGAGKTAISKRLAEKYSTVSCFFFDSVGVPPLEEMGAEYGSREDVQVAPAPARSSVAPNGRSYSRLLPMGNSFAGHGLRSPS